METRKRWQLYLIVVVVLLTIYNILPTIFYYSKPLHEPIGEREGNRVALSIAKRVNSLEGDAIDWLRSFFRLLKIKPSNASICVAIRSRNQRSWLMTTAHPAKFSNASSRARIVFTSKSLVASSSRRTLASSFSLRP